MFRGWFWTVWDGTFAVFDFTAAIHHHGDILLIGLGALMAFLFGFDVAGLMSERVLGGF